ncbi:MAG: type I restriction-modification system subunit M N-terminal domain-containing protein [Actinobacteria bacterium]|nr:type I restriction-modification system subunit M N-terminal domain-containing protein [Actinomycetota bacterium]
MLGLIFLAYAEHRFEQVRPELEAKATARRPVTADDYRARSVLFVPDEARLSHLVHLPEGQDLGAAVDSLTVTPSASANSLPASIVASRNRTGTASFMRVGRGGRMIAPSPIRWFSDLA